MRSGLLVPLYGHPGSAWDALAKLKSDCAEVPVVAIVNPCSGPGESRDQSYSAEISTLQASGATVIGYAPTSYASRTLAEVEAVIDRYVDWYRVKGIFFDEMSTLPRDEGYYSSLNEYAKSLGLEITVGNPGTSMPPSVVRTMDVVVIYEGEGLPSLRYLERQSSDGERDFAVMAYGVPAMDPSFLRAAMRHVSLVYLTDQGLPNPYYAPSSYIPDIAHALLSGNGPWRDPSEGPFQP